MDAQDSTCWLSRYHAYQRGHQAFIHPHKEPMRCPYEHCNNLYAWWWAGWYAAFDCKELPEFEFWRWQWERG